MKEYHIFYAPEIAATHELPSEEASHAVRVLRMKEDDELLVTDGKGKIYHCRITLCSKNSCHLSIENEESVGKTWRGNIHLAVAPTKNMDRMEWLAEKVTEIGIDSLTFLNCDYSERTVVKAERIEKILVSAMKQSHKARKPQLVEMMKFKDFIKRELPGQKFIAHCYEGEKIPLFGNVNPDGDTWVMIGPEGDFSIEEVKMAEAAGFVGISLGESRLRTETAGIAAVHTMILQKSDKKG